MILCGYHAEAVLWTSGNKATIDHRQPNDAQGGEHSWMLDGPKKNLFSLRKAIRNGEYCDCHKEAPEAELPKSFCLNTLENVDQDSVVGISA